MLQILWHSEQIEHVNYEYWNRWPWNKLLQILANLVRKLECTPIVLKFGTKSNMLIVNILLGIGIRDTKLHIWVNVVPKLKSVLSVIKFGTQSKSNVLVMNILLPIVHLGLKLQTWANFVPYFKFVSISTNVRTQNKSNMLIMKKTTWKWLP